MAKAVDNRWEYLLLHRLATGGDFWQDVTGGVEEGGEMAAAARREMFEEIGLVPTALQKLKYTYSSPVADVDSPRNVPSIEL
jgi:8-oxo-dGTP pyrophosphatase MutT (NUDIX family)